MSVKVFQVHKRASYEYKYIQDKYSISPDGKVFALADGTTQSFNSEAWAEIITNEFVKNPCFEPLEAIKLFKGCVEKFQNIKFTFSANPAKASLEKSKQSKGGTTTFLALRFLNKNKIELISCGDSNVFLLESTGNIITFPFSDLDSLDANNNFINTESLIKGNVDDKCFLIKSLEYKSGNSFVLATDALSRLIIKKPAILSELLQIEEFNQLNSFCVKYWDSKELQEDDISAIIINIDFINTIKTIIPPIGFSFPKEMEEEFTPALLTQNNNEIKLNDMQMSELRNQFNGISSDFRQVKKKQKFHEMLMMVAISLMLISLLYSILFQNSSIPEKTNNDMFLQQQLYEKDDIINSMQKEIDKLNKQLQAKDTTTKKRDIVINNKRDTNVINKRPKPIQNTKIENKGADKIVVKKQDSITNKR